MCNIIICVRLLISSLVNEMAHIAVPTMAKFLAFMSTVAAGLLLLSPVQASTTDDFLLVAYGSLFATQSGVYILWLGNGTWSKLPLANISSVSALAYDRTNDVVFWADDIKVQISMSSMDGSGQKVLVKNIGFVYGMQYSAARNTLYYAEYSRDSVTAFDFASTTGRILATNIPQPWDMALDDDAGLLYYTGANTTGRVDVTDGSSMTLVTAPAATVTLLFGVALSPDGKDLHLCGERQTKPGGPKTSAYFSTAVSPTSLLHLTTLQDDCLSLAASDDYLYISTSQDVRVMPLVNPGSYQSLGKPSPIGSPVGIYYVRPKTESSAEAAAPLWIIGVVLALAAAVGTLVALVLRRRSKKRYDEKDADWGDLSDLTPSSDMVAAHRVVRLVKMKPPGVKVTTSHASRGGAIKHTTESKKQQHVMTDPVGGKLDNTGQEIKADVPSHPHSHSKAKVQPFPP